MYRYIYGSKDIWEMVGGLLIKILNTRKREHRSFTGREFKTKIRVEVEKAQRKDRRGVFNLSIAIEKKPCGL